MSDQEFPRQATFSIEKEDWGSVRLADETLIDARFVLADLVITSEDLLGSQAVLGHTVLVRTRASPTLIKEFAGKPLIPDTPIPMTEAEGFERVEIQEVAKPIESIYSFEGTHGKYLLSVKVNIQSVVRNKRFKTLNGSPVYNIRWTLDYRITKV
jgi:hypothetical protein